MGVIRHVICCTCNHTHNDVTLSWTQPVHSTPVCSDVWGSRGEMTSSTMHRCCLTKWLCGSLLSLSHTLKSNTVSNDFTSLRLFGHSWHFPWCCVVKSCEKQTAQLFLRPSCWFSPCMCVKPNVSRHIVADAVLCQLEIKQETWGLKFHQQYFRMSKRILEEKCLQVGPKIAG